jgi:uncharacterized protein (DUF885 family)
MLNRREALFASAAITAIPLGVDAQTAEDARLNALFDRFVQQNLRARPESATNLGLDKGTNRDRQGQGPYRRSAGPDGADRPSRALHGRQGEL